MPRVRKGWRKEGSPGVYRRQSEPGGSKITEKSTGRLFDPFGSHLDFFGYSIRRQRYTNDLSRQFCMSPISNFLQNECAMVIQTGLCWALNVLYSERHDFELGASKHLSTRGRSFSSTQILIMHIGRHQSMIMLHDQGNYAFGSFLNL